MAGELHREIVLPAPLAEVFEFFSNAGNLAELTPPWVDFEMLTEGPVEMKVGALIDYRIKIHGIPVGWRTEITEWDPPHAFTDEQLRGPYRKWIHRHRFEEAEGGTRVTDHVEYAAPGGRLVEALFVRRDVERIFDRRTVRLLEIFSG
ncbi:MAG: CDP-paratose 2-epimerase [Armatimonadia bacterium]|nr:CDP-paratose 2-epimerase [Armatimonadia bacterium]